MNTKGVNFHPAVDKRPRRLCVISFPVLMVLTVPKRIAPFIAGRIHAADETVGGLEGFESSSSRASAGVFQPRVLRSAWPPAGWRSR
jgi:hypothetical protein